MSNTGNIEESIAKRLRNGDNGAMREFYSLYAGYLTGVCSRYVTDDDDMKDVFQESLIHIITHIADFSYRGNGSLKAWATKIVVNESLRFLRDTKRHELMLLDREVPDVPEDDDPPINDVPPDVIHRMVSQLPTGYRMVFNLYVFENKSHREIAALLGIKEKSSASQLSRAKNLLAKMIRQYNDKEFPR